MSGLLAKETFLIDTFTGHTWVHAVGKDDSEVWQRVVDIEELIKAAEKAAKGK
jgi:hypothetical protein